MFLRCVGTCVSVTESLTGKSHKHVTIIKGTHTRPTMMIIHLFYKPITDL